MASSFKDYDSDKEHAILGRARSNTSRCNGE